MTTPASPVRLGRVLERPLESRRFENCASIADVRRWLLGPARRIPEFLELLDELCWRLVNAGAPLARVTFHLPTLHPQYYGTGCRWSLATGRTEETLIAHGVRDTAQYLDSPIRRVIETGQVIRRPLDTPDAVLDFPILVELRDQGMTEYVAIPSFELSNGRRMAITLSTDRPGGFRDSDLAELETLGPHLTPLLDVHLGRQITRNLLDAYLGHQIGRRVLAGEVLRGRGETIRAVVWLCDLRGFTHLSDRLPGPHVIAILNAYFERVVDELHARGG